MKHYTLAFFIGTCMLVTAAAGGYTGIFAAILFFAFAAMCISFGLMLSLWRRPGLRNTAACLLYELYFPALRWSFFFIVFHNAFAFAGLTPSYWSLGDSLQSLFDATFTMSGHDEVLAGTMSLMRALFFGSVLAILAEMAVAALHPSTGQLRVRLVTSGVLLALCLLKWVFGLSLDGLGTGLPAAMLISCGALLSAYLPEAVESADESNGCVASCWLRRSLVVVAFAPLVFALMGKMGFEASGSGALLYAIAGSVLPCAWLETYRMLERRYGFTLSYRQLLRYDSIMHGAATAWQWMLIAMKGLRDGTKKALAVCYHVLSAMVRAVGRGVKRFVQGIKDIINASSPEDE